jgi:Zn-dependent protease
LIYAIYAWLATARQGSIRLFRFAEIDLFLHWSWFMVAAFEISSRAKTYSSLAWNVVEYLALFLIVMLHEYGHALACRQVGGTADQIVLWPLGGVAYVNPPPRPGATLWSIAAGPLVNVVLLPILLMLGSLSRSLGWAQTMPNAHHLLRAVGFINLALLLFNMLPIYPLDGGQILRSLLWFVVGRARSLMVATIIGFVGVAGVILLAFRIQSVWFGVVALFMLINCSGGLRQAQALSRLAKLPRHDGFACPSCKAAPPLGDFWKCGQCSKPFDPFLTQAGCPHCASPFDVTMCLDCHRPHPMNDWVVPALAPRPCFMPDGPTLRFVKRPVGVMATAICTFLGSLAMIGFFVLTSAMLFTSRPKTASPSGATFGLAILPAMFGVLGAWGIITGIGLLRLRTWARISILVFSGLLAFTGLAAGALMLLAPLPPKLPHNYATVHTLWTLVYAAFGLLGTVWLYYFNRRATREAFGRTASGSSISVDGVAHLNDHIGA